MAAVAADTLDQAEAAVKLIEIEWEELEPLLDAEEAVRRGSLVSESNTYERGDYERGARRGRRWSSRPSTGRRR